MEELEACRLVQLCSYLLQVEQGVPQTLPNIAGMMLHVMELVQWLPYVPD
jgi:hypothetical protein